MGNFYVNFTTRGPKQSDVVKCLRAAKRKAYVGPTVDELTVFFEEETDRQDEAAVAVVGKQASKDLKAPVLAVLNHDDDILAYWLFDVGKLADEYNSCPGYFDGGDETPTGGDAKKLCAAFAVPTKAKEVERVLRDEEFVFALERHEALARLLKLPWSHACLGYRYIEEGSLAEGVNKKDLVHTG
jgi:hypothetical protein